MLLYLALRDVDLAEIGASLRHASSGPLFIALLSVAINNLAKAVRWQIMLAAMGKPLRLSRVFMFILVGQALNLFLPGRAGDFTRAVAVGHSVSGSVFAFGTIALEKILDLVCYGFLFMWMLLVLPMPAWFQNSGYTLTATAVLVTAGVWMLACYPDKFEEFSSKLITRLPQNLQSKTISFIHTGLSSLKVVVQFKQLIALAFLSATVWATAIWTNQLVFQSLHIKLPWITAVFLLLFLQAGISFSLSLGRIGIFQYICFLVLSLFGVSRVVSVSYGILLQAIVSLPTTLLGLVFLFIISLSRVPQKPPHALEQVEFKVKQGYEG